MSPTERREIKADVLARVEGEGAMHVVIADGEVEDVQLRIFEPPRFFEAFLRGRSFTEVPDITARICGICPVAYQTSAMNAVEDLAGVQVPEPIRLMRRLLYCGEWIESHTLHVYMLHAPDFLGYESAFTMAADHREVVERGLALKKAGNELMGVVGGREIHPINTRVGGFYRAPSRAQLAAVGERLGSLLEGAEETVRFAASLPFPEFEESHDFVALSHPDEYAIERGRLVSSDGLDLAPAQYEEHFAEEHVEHSTALHSARCDGGGTYMVGPLARYALNHDKLTPRARAAAEEAGLGAECRNPFKSIVVRSVEILFAIEEAVRILEAYEPPDPPAVEVPPHAGTGHGWSEAPRGLLYHRYRCDEGGTILDAKIVPPTSQNQRAIEEDLYGYVRQAMDLPDKELTIWCEQAIRNYDPCISCSTHFLDLTVERRP